MECKCDTEGVEDAATGKTSRKPRHKLVESAAGGTWNYSSHICVLDLFFLNIRNQFDSEYYFYYYLSLKKQVMSCEQFPEKLHNKTFLVEVKPPRGFLFIFTHWLFFFSCIQQQGFLRISSISCSHCGYCSHCYNFFILCRLVAEQQQHPDGSFYCGGVSSLQILPESVTHSHTLIHSVSISLFLILIV